MKRYGIVLAAVFALVAAAVSLRAQAQDNDPDRWLKIDGWTGTYTATRQVERCLGRALFTANDSVSVSVRFNERILKRNSIIWKGTTTATVRLDQNAEELAGICGHFSNDNRSWMVTKGSGIVTDTGRLTINLRRGTYDINFGQTVIEVEQKGKQWMSSELVIDYKKRDRMGFVTLHDRVELPVSGLELSGTQTFDSPSYQPLSSITSWSLQPDECSLGSDIPEVVISKPGKDAELVFRNEPGEIDSQAVAYFILEEHEVPESLPRSLEWTFPEIAGSTLKTKPEDGRGKEVEFFYEGMPEKNSEFGKEREVSVILTPFMECMEPVRHPVRVFFERDGVGNPSGEAPNWFYYWMQTRAGHDQGEGQVAYGGGGGTCEGSFGWFNGVKDPDLVIICNGAQEENIHPITGRTTEGIDMFAVTVIHELQHLTDYKKWWGKFDEDHRPDGTYEEYIRNRFYEHGPAWRDYLRKRKQADRDGDRIPDELEEEMGFDPEDDYSRNDGFIDGEYYAYEAESTWVNGSSDEEDWAVPGKQSGGN